LKGTKHIFSICRKVFFLIIILLFPLTYADLSNLDCLLLAIFLSVLILINKSGINKFISNENLRFFILLIFIYMFDKVEGLNFNQQYNLGLKFQNRISFSTILLVVVFICYAIRKVFSDVKVNNMLPLRYIFTGFAILMILTIAFYSILSSYYDTSLNTLYPLIGKATKFLVLFPIVFYSGSDNNLFKKLSFWSGVSIILVLILCIILT